MSPMLPKYRPLLIAAAVLLVLPFALSPLGLTLTTATDVVIFAIACMGLNILVGHTGLVSFGHGAFFGLAGYAAALSQRHWFPDGIIIPALFAVGSVMLFAFLAGFLILRRRGVYFSLLTLVLPAMLFAIAFRWTAVTGGESGLGGVVRPIALGVDLGSPWVYYAVVAMVGLVVTVLLWRFHGSPVGSVLVAIRENEQRARFIGYPTDRYKLIAFTASATIMALAGTLSVFHHRFASADPISLPFSGQLLAMVVIGGMRSFLGPALGALFFILFREVLSVWTPNWLLFFDLLFVGFIIFSPNGLVGVATRLYAPFAKRKVEAFAMADRVIAEGAPLTALLANRKRRDGPVLIARELAKSFGGIRAVVNADIVVPERTLHALIGPNGAGKTTVLNLLSGMFAPDKGFITVAGRSVTGLAPEDITRAGVGRSFQIANLFGGLTVEENMRLAVQARSARRFAWWASAQDLSDINAETAAFMSYLGLTGMERADAASLSYGGQRLLDMGLALATAPHILLLDEPLAGLAAAERARVAALVKAISAHIPVLLAEHDIDGVFQIADVVTVMNEGSVLVHGSVDEARNNAKLREIYLGSGTAHVTAQVPPSAAGATTLLSVDKIDTFYGKSQIINGVSLDVSENEIVALLGRNGAGKSTLLKTLIGIAPPQNGSIKLSGEEIGRLASAPIARRGIGYVPQGGGLFGGMTVADNLALGRLKRQTGAGVNWDDDRIVWVFPRLAQRWYTPADHLSGGEQQMVAVARALAGDVRLLLLDEPFEGLSPAITEELFEAFNRLRYEIAMVIVAPQLDLALALSDRTVILERGSVSWTGQSKLLRDDLDLRRQKLWT
jgi:ABC-type branched-subunit amino acid transport system ATPase component/ABC-type branched-subunit amino acid transport system permease subunit